MSFLNDCASEMVYPLIPIYLSAVLMSGPRVLGLIEGVADLLASGLKLASGWIMDRSGRTKPWIVTGYGLAGAGRPLIPLFAIRLTDRMGKGLRTTPRDALLALSAGSHQRGLVFGLHRALDNAGAVCGPLVAAALLGAGLLLQSIFYWSALPAAMCLALAMRLPSVPTPTKQPDVPSTPGTRPQQPTIRVSIAIPTGLHRYLVVVALFTLGKSSTLFLLLRANELGVSQTHIPLLWAAVSGVAAILSTPFSALSDRFGRIGMLTAGYALYGVFYLAMGFMSHSGVLLSILFICYGVFIAATEGVERAMVADLAPRHLEGTAFGWFHLVSGAFLLPASVMFGTLYESHSALLAFAFSGSCALGAALLLWAWVKVPPGGARASPL